MIKNFLKKLIILLILCGIINCIPKDKTTTVISKEIKITHIDTVKATVYTILKKEIPKIETDQLNKKNIDSSETRNQDINISNEQDIIVNNSITIPNVCTNALLSIGSTQEAVDNNDICIMTSICKANFGDGKAVLLGGHSNRSLKYLYNSGTDDVITVCYNNINYMYKIIYSNECISNGHALYDIKTKESMLDFTLEQEILYIYTCYNDNNWLVKAIREV